MSRGLPFSLPFAGLSGASVTITSFKKPNESPIPLHIRVKKVISTVVEWFSFIGKSRIRTENSSIEGRVLPPVGKLKLNTDGSFNLNAKTDSFLMIGAFG